MKSKNYSFFLFITLLFSCKEEFLETRPLSFYAPENVYTDEKGINSLVITMKKDYGIIHYDQFSIMADQYSYSDLCVPGSYNPSTIRNLVNNLTPAVTVGD